MSSDNSQPISQPKFAVGQTVYHDGVKVLINSRMFVDGQWYYLLANGDITAVESSLTAQTIDEPQPQKSLGQVAYEKYVELTRPLPSTKTLGLFFEPWESFTFQGIWCEVARAVLEARTEPKLEQPQSRNAFGDGFVIEHPVGMSPTQRKIVVECMTLLTTLINKNRDYGDSAFKSPSLMPSLSAVDAVAVRMSDKIARIANLSSSQRSSGPAVSDESLIDTYLDLAGYAVLQVINLREAKPTRVNGQHSAAAYKQELTDEGTVGGKIIDTPCGPVNPSHCLTCGCKLPANHSLYCRSCDLL